MINKHIICLSNIEKITTSEKLLFYINAKFLKILYAEKYYNQNQGEFE